MMYGHTNMKQKIFFHSLTEAYRYVTSRLNLLYIAKFEVLRALSLQSSDF